jgi:hypothetical protein
VVQSLKSLSSLPLLPLANTNEQYGYFLFILIPFVNVKILKVTPNLGITYKLLGSSKLCCVLFFCVFPKKISLHLLMKNKQDFIIFNKINIFQPCFKINNSMSFMFSFYCQINIFTIPIGFVITLSLASYLVERPSYSSPG